MSISQMILNSAKLAIQAKSVICSYFFSFGVHVLHTGLCIYIALSIDGLLACMSRMALTRLALDGRLLSFPSLMPYLYVLHLQIAVMFLVYKIR